jgi:hypothetical protein
MFEDFTQCQVCEHNPTGERCEYFGRVIGMHGCSSGVERKPRNNYERVKQMTMEELAVLFNGCESEGRAYGPKGKAAWLKWLNAEDT